MSKYKKKPFIINFTFQDVYIELTEVGHHHHRRRESFREKPEGDETLEQVLLTKLIF